MIDTVHENVKSDLHRAALDYAARGWPVFPILPGTKTPATEHGFHDATVDPAQIDAWWSANPLFNIAFSPHTAGLSVVDLDGPEAETNWAGLQLVHGDAPRTLEVETPRGRHLYFKGELPPTQSKLADHVDTRGRGSYALLPPSRIGDRTYRAVNDLIYAEVPAWVAAGANLKREKAKAAVTDLDLPANIARARAYLETAKPAIQGQMGDKQTFVTACDVLNLGVSPETATELMSEVYNPRCVPPWDLDELEIKIANAAAYAQNEAGSWATGEARDVFDSDVLGKLLAESAAQPPPKRRFKPQSIGERRNLPPPTWLIPDMIQDKAVSMIYGPGGGGKTFIALRLGLDLAQAGKRVVYVMGEGGTGPDQRVRAWELLNDADADAIPFSIVDEMPTAIDQEAMIEFAREMADYRPDLIIVDTLAWFALGYKENDASEMMRVVRALTTVSREIGCAVLAIHHTGKDATRGARGSDAFLFGINSALEVQTQAKLIAVHARRQKDAAIRKEPWVYELRDLGPSAVAVPVEARAWREREAADDLIGPKRLAGYLREMGAVGAAKSVTSHVLAAHAIQHSTDVPDDPEVLQEQAVQLARVLAKRAKGSLGGYTYGEGDTLRWAIPDE